MENPKRQFRKDIEKAEKLSRDEPARLYKGQARRETDLAREQIIQKEQLSKEARRAEKLSAEEPARLAKAQIRRETDLAREQAVTKDQETRRRKANR